MAEIEVGDIWYCKIGQAQPHFPDADWLMREAVTVAYRTLTGKEPDFIFSGWGAQLTESERAVVENRLPKLEPIKEDEKDEGAFDNRSEWTNPERVDVTDIFSDEDIEHMKSKSVVEEHMEEIENRKAE